MTKDKVLIILKSSGDYVSGESMSRELGVSRAAVNSAVKALRQEGYEISSVTNRGYMLCSSPDRLSQGEIEKALPAGRGETVKFLETVDSTNNYLKNKAGDGSLPDGYTVVADHQTGGRGRRGRSFSSPPGCGVYLSMLIRPDSAPGDTAGITAWVAVAVCDAIEKTCGIRPGIKWINDIIMGRRKVAGILTELSVEGESGHIQYIVIGIGINTNQRESDFPPELSEIAGSVAMAAGKSIDRGRLAGELINSLDRMRRGWPHEKERYLAAYRRDCVTIGKEVLLVRNGEQKKAFAKDIDDDFSLIAELPDGSLETVFTGEVSVRGLYGYV